MTMETIKPESFTDDHIYTFRDEMLLVLQQMKSFGVLMEYADLERFSDVFKDAGEYRGGLNGIIELIIEKQERLVDELISKYNKSPEIIIKRAAVECELINQGAFGNNHKHAVKSIHTTIEGLDAVIEAFGDAYPRALELKKELTGLKERLMGGESK